MINSPCVAEDTCAYKDFELHKTCKMINYEHLPQELKKLMKKAKCEKGIRSGYVGYSIDINDDGQPEIFFCCGEAPHGPCYANIYGKVKGIWKNLTNNTGFSGYGDNETPCLGFSILKTKNEGYRDIFQDGNLYRFQNGAYKSEFINRLPPPQEHD
jgi:hypothetical protein